MRPFIVFSITYPGLFIRTELFKPCAWRRIGRFPTCYTLFQSEKNHSAFCTRSSFNPKVIWSYSIYLNPNFFSTDQFFQAHKNSTHFLITNTYEIETSNKLSILDSNMNFFSHRGMSMKFI